MNHEFRIFIVAANGAVTSEGYETFTQARDTYTAMVANVRDVITYISLQGRTPDGRWEILDEEGPKP